MDNTGKIGGIWRTSAPCKGGTAWNRIEQIDTGSLQGTAIFPLRYAERKEDKRVGGKVSGGGGGGGCKGWLDWPFVCLID